MITVPRCKLRPKRPFKGVLSVDFRAACAVIWRRLRLSAALPVQRESLGVEDGWDGSEDSLLSPQSALVSSQCCRDKAPVVIEVVLTVVDFRRPGQPCLRSEERHEGEARDQANPRGQASNEFSPV
jgi:hypothetical protein